MQTNEVTAEEIRLWNEIYQQYRPLLKPQRKSAEEVLQYAAERYPLQEITDESVKQLVIENVTDNPYFAKKIPEGKIPRAVIFTVMDTDSGKELYQKQDLIFQGIPILFGLELLTGFFLVEGSSLLWDELFVFRGLDEEDLDNVYLVAEYIKGLERFGKLDALQFES